MTKSVFVLVFVVDALLLFVLISPGEQTLRKRKGFLQNRPPRYFPPVISSEIRKLHFFLLWRSAHSHKHLFFCQNNFHLGNKKSNFLISNERFWLGYNILINLVICISAICFNIPINISHTSNKVVNL